MLRNIIAVVVGLFVGSLINMGLIRLNTEVLFPMPEGTSTEDTEAFNAYLAGLPATAFLVVMAAHLLQSLVGAFIAARIAAARPMLVAMIVGVLSLVGGVAALFMFEGPAWMPVELPFYLILAWFAGRIEVRRRGDGQG